MAGPFHAPSLAGGMGQVAGRGCLRQGSPNNNTQKFKQTFCRIEMHSAHYCTHTATLTDERWHTVTHTHAKLKKLGS